MTLAGDEARADVWGLYFGDEERKIDLNYIIRQEGRRTDANMQVRGALLDHSVKTFRGHWTLFRGRAARSARRTRRSRFSRPMHAIGVFRSCSHMRAMWTDITRSALGGWTKTSSFI